MTQVRIYKASETDTLLALKAPLASPTFTGNPIVPNQSAGNNSTRAANTAYVDTGLALKANLASPTFTGNPVAVTQAEGNNSTRIATTEYVDRAVGHGPIELEYALSDETTNITTGTKVTTHAPRAFTLTEVFAGLTAVSTSGLPTFDVKVNGVSVFSTKVTIDANEDNSSTATTPAVIANATIAKYDKIEISIDVAGTGAKGAKIALIGTRT